MSRLIITWLLAFSLLHPQRLLLEDVHLSAMYSFSYPRNGKGFVEFGELGKRQIGFQIAYGAAQLPVNELTGEVATARNLSGRATY